VTFRLRSELAFSQPAKRLHQIRNGATAINLVRSVYWTVWGRIY